MIDTDRSGKLVITSDDAIIYTDAWGYTTVITQFEDGAIHIASNYENVLITAIDAPAFRAAFQKIYETTKADRKLPWYKKYGRKAKS